MTTSAKTTYATKLYRGGSGSPKTGGTAIEEVQDLGLPEEVSEAINATSHDSSGVAEYIPSELIDGGEVTGTLLYSAATGQVALYGDLGGAAQGYYINFPGGSGKKQLDFSACVTRWKWGDAPAQTPDALKAEFTMKITGAVTVGTQS